MKILKIQNAFKFFNKFSFGILILVLIAAASSIGSFIEQDEDLSFYQQNYPLEKPIYGIINWKVIKFLGLDSVYSTWWFIVLLLTLVISLISCSVTRQFPIVTNAKEYFFKKQSIAFLRLPLSVKFKNIYYLKETILIQLQKLKFYIYQNKNLIYGYQGLIGRISPILVHISLILILAGSSVGAFVNFTAQELLPKGEIFRIQNTIKVGPLTTLPIVNIRVNDFWVDYENDRIHQFYSNISILNCLGEEIKEQTISVNNPLRFNNIDIYQSDWNLLGVRIKDLETQNVSEIPLFQLKQKSKSWITWIKDDITIIIDKLENNYNVYNKKGELVGTKNLGDKLNDKLIIIDTLPSTGLLIKYDPTITIIYAGFALLIITTFLSYLPYTQIWIFTEKGITWLGGTTNRGKLQLELEFENLIRYIEAKLMKSEFAERL
jgi:cytochrome c biogenesis protein